MIKKVKEYLTEKFTANSDPIRDLGIGNLFYTIEPGDIIICEAPGNKVFRSGTSTYAVVTNVKRDENILTLDFIPFNAQPRGLKEIIKKCKNHDTIFFGIWQSTAHVKDWKQYFKIKKAEEILTDESINEVFTQDSDPIQDMGIGIRKKVDEWLKTHVSIGQLEYQLNLPEYSFNSDGTIDVNGGVWLHKNSENGIMPIYIKFNVVNGYFDMGHLKYKSLRGCPEVVNGYFRCSTNNLRSLKYSPKGVQDNYYAAHNPGNFTKEDVKRYCKYISGRIDFEEHW